MNRTVLIRLALLARWTLRQGPMGASSQRERGTSGREDGRGALSEPPQGWGRLKAVGPGFLWMVAAAGSGELLFTPRVAAQYGYALLWALLAAVALKWFINREVGRYAVCTGASIIEGFHRLPGPRNWAVWVIIVPQLVVAAVSVAGLASSAATALILLLPGGMRLWTVITLVVAATLVVWGQYSRVEWATRLIAVALALVSFTAVVSVWPSVDALAGGLVPHLPDQVDYGEVLPWLGYALSGAAGLMWYSYWLTAKGYGAAAGRDGKGEPLDPKALSVDARRRLRGWLRQMTLDTTVAVVGATLITIAFLILGAELLRPHGLVPAEDRVAETLGTLLGGVFGRFGYWFMIVGLLTGFYGTVLSNQDGFGRLLANGTHLLLRAFGLQGRWTDEAFLKNVFVIGLVTLVPMALFLLVGQPVGLLKLSGAIEAAHIPFVTGLTLYLNHRALPPELRPSWLTFVVTTLAGLFFVAFAAIYLFTLVTSSSG